MTPGTGEAAALAEAEALLERLARRAQKTQLIVGLVLLVLVVGLLFFAFALWIELRKRQCVEALRAAPSRLRSVRLQTRRVGPLGITAVTTVFAVIGFESAGGARRTFDMQGRAADLARLVRTLQRAVPGLRVDDPQEVSVIVV